MRYTVRSKEGELKFQSFGEVEQAWLMGLVGPDDELQEEGQNHWRKAGSIPLLVQARRRGDAVWGGTQLAWILFSIVFGSIALYCFVKGVQRQDYKLLSIGFVIALGVGSALTTVTYKAFKKTRPH